MSSYIETTYTAEELLVEEELIEAVGAFVETAAVNIQQEIVNDLQTFTLKLKSIVYYVFPILLQDKESIHAELKTMAVAFVLFVIAFIVLEPWQNNYKKTLPTKQQKRRHIPFIGQRSESLSDGQSSEEVSLAERESVMGIGNEQQQEQDQTDEERFAQQWPGISLSRYRKLVLPPVCRLVDKGKRGRDEKIKNTTAGGGSVTTPNKKNKVETSEGRASSSEEQTVDVHDNPAKRLQNYVRWFLYFFRSILSYDYAGAGWTLIVWMQGIRNHRRTNSKELHHHDVQEDHNGEGEGESEAHFEEEQTMDTSPVTEHDESEQESVVLVNNAEIQVIHAGVYGGENGDVQDETVVLVDPVSPLENSNYLDQHTSNNFPVIPNNLHREVSDASVYYDIMSNNDPQQQTTPPFRNIKDSHDNIHSSLIPTTTTPTRSKSPTNLMHRLSLRRKDLRRKSSPDLFRMGSGSGGGGTMSNSSPSFTSSSSSTKPLASSMRGRTRAMSAATTSGEATTMTTLPETCCEESDATTTTPNAKVFDRSDSQTHYFSSVQSQPELNMLASQMPVPDKNGYIVGDEFLPYDNNSRNYNYTPLLVFVNSRAGPQQGHLLITQLKRLLNPIQVWDLADGGPEQILESFIVFTRLRILVCGGDGTVSWIVSALDKMFSKDESNKAGTTTTTSGSSQRSQLHKWPPIAILPLGTGNDLARIHGWGGGYNNESLIMILEQISESYSSLLDRWEVTIDTNTSSGSKNHKTALHHSSKTKQEVKTFFNYLGVGADAQAALQVHYLRESRPEWFFSRIINKAWYGVFGAEDIIMASSVNVRKDIKLFADGVEVSLPPDSQGIILLNIDSYAGGVPLWSHGTPSNVSAATSPLKLFRRSLSMNALYRQNGMSMMERMDSSDDLQTILSDEENVDRVTACDRPSSCQDGILEIVSIRGAFHLGQIRVGLSNAQRLCQCREATIIIKNKVAVQIDGEPWRQRQSTFTIRRKKEPAVMLHRSADDGGVETEMSKLLDWAEERRYIDCEVHTILMKEFSRRIESKTRKRRVRERDNIMHTLKKAISQGGLASNLQTANDWQFDNIMF